MPGADPVNGNDAVCCGQLRTLGAANVASGHVRNRRAGVHRTVKIELVLRGTSSSILGLMRHGHSDWRPTARLASKLGRLTDVGTRQGRTLGRPSNSYMGNRRFVLSEWCNSIPSTLGVLKCTHLPVPRNGERRTIVHPGANLCSPCFCRRPIVFRAFPLNMRDNEAASRRDNDYSSRQKRSGRAAAPQQ